MGLHFRIEHANWLAHVLESTGVTPPPIDHLDQEELVQFLYSFEYNFFSYTDWRERLPFLTRQAADEIRQTGNVSTAILQTLRDYAADIEWVALLLPSGFDEQSDAILTSRDFLRRLAQDNLGTSGIILQLEVPPREQSFTLSHVFPAFQTALAESTRWPGVLVWSGAENSAFFPLPTDLEGIKDRLQWLFARLSRGGGGEILGQLKEEYKELTAIRGSASPLQIIHLSDIHLGSRTANERIVRVKQLIRSVSRLLGAHKNVVPIVTGDLMDTPSKENINLVRDFTDFLRDLGVAEPIALIGNHDTREIGVFDESLREALSLPRQPIVWFDESNVGLLCFDSVRGGNLARGEIGVDQMMEMGNLLDREPDKTNDYALIAALHHHPIPVIDSSENPTKWHERFFGNVLGNLFEKTLTLKDAEVFNEWLINRKCIAVLHGHKHIPRFKRQNNISYIGCGSTVGKGYSDDVGRTNMSINIVTVDKEAGRLSCQLRAEEIPGGGLNEGETHEFVCRQQLRT